MPGVSASDRCVVDAAATSPASRRRLIGISCAAGSIGSARVAEAAGKDHRDGRAETNEYARGRRERSTRRTAEERPAVRRRALLGPRGRARRCLARRVHRVVLLRGQPAGDGPAAVRRSVWTNGLDWILTIGVPTVAVFLIVLRRFSPDGIRRVGSLGIDQFASVAFSVSAVVWLTLAVAHRRRRRSRPASGLRRGSSGSSSS